MVHQPTNDKKPKCPRCRGGDIDIVPQGDAHMMICLDCGYEESQEI